MEDIKYKKCKCCNEIKSITEYHIHNGARDGYRSECRTCRRLNRNHKLAMLLSAKQRAKKHGIPFDITIDDINIPEKCPVFDIPLKINPTRMKDNSPSLDRLVPSKGYTRGNIEVISNKANVIKNNATFQEIYMVAKWLERKMNG